MTDLLFSKRARHVMKLAQDEARSMNHSYVGTEHILLALMHEDEGLAERLGVSLKATHEQVETLIGRGVTAVKNTVPLSPNARSVLTRAVDETAAMGYVDVTHILKSLLCEDHCIAAIILQKFSVDTTKLLEELATFSHDDAASREAMYRWALQQSHDIVPQLEAARRHVVQLEKQQNRLAQILASYQEDQAHKQ